jgi:flagellin
MEVKQNINAINASRIVENSNNKNSNLTEKLSSGYRINRAGEGAAGNAVFEKMRSQIDGIEQEISNAQDAVSVIQFSEGSLLEIDNLLSRMKTLSCEQIDSNDTSPEYEQLCAEIDKIAAAYADSLKESAEDLTSDGLGVSFAKVSFASAESKMQATEAIEKAIDKISELRSKCGLFQNRLEHKINNLTATVENLTSSEARMRDNDMESEMNNNSKAQILRQASQSMLSQANQLPEGVLKLME